MAFQRFFLLRFLRDSPLTKFFVTHTTAFFTHTSAQFDWTAFGRFRVANGAFAGVSITFLHVCMYEGTICFVMGRARAGYLRLGSSAHSLYEYKRLRSMKFLGEWI